MRSTPPPRRPRSRRAAPLTVVLGGEPVELSPDDVVLRVRGQQGFAVSREGGEVVALDLDLDEGLRKRGLSRDVVRLVQDLRKSSGLEVSDRIRLHVVGLDVIAEFFDFIAREVLAVDVISGPGRGRGDAPRARRRAAHRAGAGLDRAGRPRPLTRRALRGGGRPGAGSR